MNKYYGIIIKVSLVLFILSLILVPVLVSAQGLVPCGQDGSRTGVVDGKLTRDEMCTVKDFLAMAINIINLAMQFAGIIAVLMIVFYGGKMVDAGLYGKAEMYTEGKKGVFMVIMGLFLILISYAAINGVWNILFPGTYGSTWFKPWQ